MDNYKRLSINDVKEKEKLKAKQKYHNQHGFFSIIKKVLIYAKEYKNKLYEEKEIIKSFSRMGAFEELPLEDTIDECKAIIDVTKPPYYVDNTGKVDCTKQLCSIVDEILKDYEKNFYETKEKLESIDDENALISFEIRKVQGKSNVIFPENLPQSKIIYFPNGTYYRSVHSRIFYFESALAFRCFQIEFQGQKDLPPAYYGGCPAPSLLYF